MGQTSIEDDVAFEGKDLSGVAMVGSAYGEIDLEALAAADPTSSSPRSTRPTRSGAIPAVAPGYGFETIEQQEQVAEIAPIVAIA